jgi:CheY-like chemotaxis protein
MVAYPLPSSRRLAKALGVKDFLSKPVTREDLFEAIDRLQISLRRVLIVDDDAEMVNLVQRMLVNRISPQDCLEAGNGEEAWEILQRERVDLVLLDLMMPGMDGRELLEQMHGMEECPPVIVISALEEPASELVGVMYVIPPQHFSPARMLGLVKTVMDELV